MAKFTLKKSLIKVTDDEGNSFSVRGLSPNDIAQLLSLHKPVMEQLFKQYVDRDPEAITSDDIANTAADMAMAMLEQAPALVAHTIALAADNVEDYEEYVKLPIGLQVEALAEIGRLSFETAGGAKKFLDLVKGLTAKARSNPSL